MQDESYSFEEDMHAERTNHPYVGPCLLTSRTSVRYSIDMFMHTLPDTLTKLAQMGEMTSYEPAGEQPQRERPRAAYQSRSLAECITQVSTPKGSLPILKTMVTTNPLGLNKSF